MTKVIAHGADLLVHEATFIDEDAERAAETSHSTARRGRRLAAEAEVKMLALTHVSPRYSGGELRDEARAPFDEHDRPARLRLGGDPAARARAAPIHHREALRSTGAQQPL